MNYKSIELDKHIAMASRKKFIYLLGIIFFSKALLIDSKAIANEHKDFLTNICHITFNSEMTISGKTAPNGMADFTCNCFVEKVTYGYSVESAKSTCKENASQKFSL